MQRYFGVDSVQSGTMKIMNIGNSSDSGQAKNDHIFDHELRPLRHVSLHEVQCKLNGAGAVGMFSIFSIIFIYFVSDLVIDLIVMDPSHDVFLKSCQLAKALLHEGNEEVQMSFYYRLREKKVAGKFFKAFITKLQAAQNRLKNDMMSGRDTKPKGGKILNFDVDYYH